MKRLFLAVPLPIKVGEELENLLPMMPGKKIPKEHWHFTLQFLGEIEAPRYQYLQHILSSLTWGSPFTATLDHLGAFPNDRSAKVLWVGVKEGYEKFCALEKLLNQILEKEGYKLDKQGFVPHLTIRRFYPPRRVSEWIHANPLQNKKISFLIDRIILYQSILGPIGSEYQELSTYFLI